MNNRQTSRLVLFANPPAAVAQQKCHFFQINYQTVVGWHLKKVVQLMNENPSELILTLKKRPRHLPVFGQIYMKPFRIPARKNDKSYFNNLPSPRAELLVAPKINFPFLK